MSNDVSGYYKTRIADYMDETAKCRDGPHDDIIKGRRP